MSQANEQDRLREWAEWANEPITPYFVMWGPVKVMTEPLELPEWIVEQKNAERFVAEISQELGLRCCLVVSRRVAIYFGPDGKVTNVKEATPEEDVFPREEV